MGALCAFYKTAEWNGLHSTMDIDLDWCLTCEKRLHDSALYCSSECRQRASPEASQSYDHQTEQVDSLEDHIIFHTIDRAPSPSRWTGNDSAGISAWAAQVPSGAPAGAISSPTEEFSSFDSPLSGATYRQPPPPFLLKPHRRLVPPSLSLASPPSALPPLSTPMELSPKRHTSLHSLTQAAIASTGQTSLRTAATESSLVATPASSQPVPIASASRKPSVLDDMYSHVRSWVYPSPTFVHTKLPPQTPFPPSEEVKFSLQARTTLLPPAKIISYPHSLHGFADQSTICWMAGTVVVEQPTKPNTCEPSRGCKLPVEGPYHHDEHPSFRTRGRKASRAAA
ncbi:hypothetical protein CPB84DRAFT_1780335 [Gymnopilus junonius]|uniref:Uncharacterized protein n=1 Tax=Gymnopilus junonius TaxID=109634 RepID=A0A9P5NJY2_GYMJU|nr:hypothetical protein CPB84DRAFT_1780335 [Gymnopilus junonius]